uniref:Helicase ATP-binding domain-containing protein n=1 Tax=viral metagenome TaxID=1070528 RepID=A0A6C0E1M7_9ZZZZ
MEDIIDFLPIYPDIDDDNFNTKISQKKELNDYKLENYEKFPEKPGDLFNHQKLISRFFSSNTPYDQLLLFHDMGTGKTCTSVACIEQIREETSIFKKAFIFTKSDLLHKNYKDDLILKCNEKNKYFNGRTSQGKLSYAKISKYYEFKTFQKFASYLSKKTNEYITENYSNTIIIIDEVHNIRFSGDDKDDKIYNQFHKFLHLIKNSKILLMSGTPMKDTFDEIADIMNLILPLDKQMPTKKDFIKKYFITENENKVDNDILYSLTDDTYLINHLKSFFKGRVSYLKSMQSSSIIKKFIGKNCFGLNKLIVYPESMKEIQNTGYVKAYDKDKKDKNNDKRSSFDTNSTLASLFVFPNGLYGENGYKNYVENNKLNDDFIKFIEKEGTDPKKMLSQISKCSVKYAFTIKKILDNVENPDRTQRKCMFVYCNRVSNGGIILFALLLNLFKFSNATSQNINKKDKRYILVKSEKEGEGKTLSSNIIKNVFNSSKNIYGEYISLVIGSRILSEGFSLFHIQEEFILTPYWNYSETAQAIARGIRSDSHNLLLDGFEFNHLNGLKEDEIQNILKELNIKSSSRETNINNIIKNKNYIKQSPIKPQINIYLLVAIPKDEKTSIDIKNYRKSEIKDINDKIIERLIKESSFDCYFNYKRNRYNDSYNNLRECDYTLCNYKCDINNNNQLDYSTDLLYYLNEDKNNSIKNKILEILKEKYFLTLNDIYLYSESLKINYKQFIFFLFQIIDNKEIVYNKYGLKSYLYIDNDIFYISDSNINNNHLSIYYNMNINIQKDFKTSNLILNKQLDSNFIENLFKETNLESIINKILELNVEIVEILLEQIIISKIEKIEKEKSFADLVFDNFFYKYCLKIDDQNILYISWLQCNKHKKDNIRTLIKTKNNNLQWVDYSDSVSKEVPKPDFKKRIEKHMKSSMKFFQEHLKAFEQKIGYYGFLTYDENKNEKFNIVKKNELKNKKIEAVKKPKTKSKKKDKNENETIDLRSINTGKLCSSWEVLDLIEIILLLKIPINTKELNEINVKDIQDKKISAFIESKNITDDEDKKKIIYYKNLKKKELLCDIILKNFKEKELIFYYFKY